MARLRIEFTDDGLTSGQTLDAPETVAEACVDLTRQAQEHFEILHLDVKHRLIARQTVAVGALDRALVHPRDVFTAALLACASAVILVHNHPSGDPTPSAQDIQLTERLEEVGRLLGIHVLDHVVVASGGFMSVMHYQTARAA